MTIHLQVLERIQHQGVPIVPGAMVHASDPHRRKVDAFQRRQRATPEVADRSSRQSMSRFPVSAGHQWASDGVANKALMGHRSQLIVVAGDSLPSRLLPAIERHSGEIVVIGNRATQHPTPT